MQAKLPVRLTLLMPAVENSVGRQCDRPGRSDHHARRATVEIDNTDAEGRLVCATRSRTRPSSSPT